MRTTAIRTRMPSYHCSALLYPNQKSKHEEEVAELTLIEVLTSMDIEKPFVYTIIHKSQNSEGTKPFLQFYLADVLLIFRFNIICHNSFEYDLDEIFQTDK